MKYKKFSNTTTAKPQPSNVSINSLEEIPLPNEIEIQPDTSKNSTLATTTTENTLSLQRLLKNIELDDLLLFAILILFLQEDVSDELLIGLIIILIIQKY